MKRIYSVVILAAVLGFCLFGIAGMNVLAKEHPTASRKVAYYTSIEIQEGDTLWKIAGKYAPELDLSVQEYVSCLRRMNRLADDTIHAGRYLTVMYCGEEEQP